MLFVSRRRAFLARALGTAAAVNLLLGNIPTLYAAAPAAQDDGLSGLCRTDTLPQDIRGSLSRNFSTWRIQEPADLNVGARTRWGAERPLTCPGIAAGHFQDPKNAGYALLIIPADHANSAFRLLIYAPTAGQQFYGFKTVAQNSSGGSDLFIAAVPVVRFFEATSKVAAQSKAPEAVMLVDSAATQAVLYVWSDLNYERQQVNYQ